MRLPVGLAEVAILRLRVVKPTASDRRAASCPNDRIPTRTLGCLAAESLAAAAAISAALDAIGAVPDAISINEARSVVSAAAAASGGPYLDSPRGAVGDAKEAASVSGAESLLLLLLEFDSRDSTEPDGIVGCDCVLKASAVIPRGGNSVRLEEAVWSSACASETGRDTGAGCWSACGGAPASVREGDLGQLEGARGLA